MQDVKRYLLVARSVLEPDAVRARIEGLAPSFASLDVASLAYTLLDAPPAPVPRIGAVGERFAVLVSMLGDLTAARAIEAMLAKSGFFVAVYGAETAVPIDYDRTWAEGSLSPGLVQLTFLRRKVGLDDDAFYAAWHEVHTPLAMEIHPLWRYARHTVREVLTEGAPPFEGIVELHFRHDEDVTDPLRFYGGSTENAKRIARDVRAWIDFGTIEVVHGRECVLRGH